MRHILFLTSITVAAAIACDIAVAAPFNDPAQTPAAVSELAARSPLIAVASAGKRVVAVGQRGHIVYSDDGGRRWVQARVPVSSDLVAVSFPTPRKGWAVGHGPVVLHTEDGGATWVKQLDGKSAARLTLDYYKAGGPEKASDMIVEQAERQQADTEAGAPAPFLDVSFDNETTGYVVGAFNRIYRTDDAGKTWTPWMARVDNPQELNLYAVRGSGDRRYIVGEQGKVWRLDAAARRFVAVPTPYSGTLFGAVVAPASVVVFGMNGTVYRSGNEGSSWEKVSLASRAGVTGGDVLPDGRILITNYASQVLASQDNGKTFGMLAVSTAMPSHFGMAQLDARRIGVAGVDGVRVIALP